MENIKAKIVDRKQLCEDIISLVLVPLGSNEFPSWDPGAHAEIALAMPNETVYRHYSLCGDYTDKSNLQIAILLEKDGRGGSAYIHQNFKVGDEVMISYMRNHFAFQPRKKCIFIAGGIGITPILPMIQKADEMQIDWKLIYTVRERSRLIFLDQLAKYDADRIVLNGDKEDGYINLDNILSTADEYTSVYSCGPQKLLNALEEKSTQNGTLWDLKIERFTAQPVDNSHNKSFEVVIHSTGERLQIPADKSILEVLKEKGFKVNSSCKNGVCGSCETVVISGLPDHRDSVLSDDEKADNETMMICVSRALSKELVLDIATK